MEARKKRKTLTIIGICVALSSLFFFLQTGLSEQHNAVYRLLGILAIVVGSVFVLFGFIKGGRKSNEFD